MEKFEHKKSLGQHFLNSEVVPKWMCDAADVTNSDVILEIGPGTGALTKELLERGSTVHAIETDVRAIKILEDTFAEYLNNQKLFIHHQDARNLDLNKLPLETNSFKIVANIPYYLSGLLFRACLSSKIQPETLVFLIQKEVAKRITENTRTGKESILSLSISIYGNPEYIRTVSKNHFTPPPKIDSAILKVNKIGKEKLQDLDEEFFFELLHLGFGQKRKQLRGNLKAKFDTKTLEKVWEELQINETIRAEDLPIETWVKLAKKLATNNDI